MDTFQIQREKEINKGKGKKILKKTFNIQHRDATKPPQQKKKQLAET